MFNTNSYQTKQDQQESSQTQKGESMSSNNFNFTPQQNQNSQQFTNQAFSMSQNQRLEQQNLQASINVKYPSTGFNAQHYQIVDNNSQSNVNQTQVELQQTQDQAFQQQLMQISPNHVEKKIILSNQILQPIQQIQPIQAFDLNSMDEQIRMKKEDLEKLEMDCKQSQQNLNSLNNQYQSQKILINSQNGKIQSLKLQIEDLQDRYEKMIKEKNKTQEQLDDVIKKKQKELASLNESSQELLAEKGLQNQKYNRITQQLRETKSFQVDQATQEIQTKINQLIDENAKTKLEIDLKQQNQFRFKHQERDPELMLKNLEQKKKAQYQQLEKKYQQKQEIENLESQLQQRDQNINQMNFNLKQEEKKLKVLVSQFEQMKEDLKLNDDRILLKKNQISQLEVKTLSALRNPDQQSLIKKAKAQADANSLLYDDEIRKQQNYITQSKIQLQKKKEEQKYQEENQKLQRQKQAKAMQMQFQESFGQIEVCFLIDSTASMEPYKMQAQMCVQGSLKAIKDVTQRDSNWATVCYVDKDILRRLQGGKYQQFGFTKDSNQLEKFIESVRCTANSDLPEDVEGGMNQMLTNLPWQTKFRIAILICDCPCHGTKYHDYGTNGDNYPNSDIEPMVQKMIQQDIFFIGIIFTPQTVKMYEEIRKIYRRNNKEEYFILADLRNIAKDLQFKELAKIITFASQVATQTNSKQTRTSKQANMIKREDEPTQARQNQDPDSSVEALCKANLSNGLNGSNAKRETFKVFRVQMKEESFLNKMKQIENVGINDFDLIQENEWDCLRSVNAFAKGAMKAAFLMTKSKYMNSKQELYVCKTPLDMQPFQNQESALKECILHIVSQKWLRKFFKDLDEGIVRSKTNQRYPQISYSDILLLQDCNQKYWLAERFFEGNFVKYNNNFGFVNRSQDDINILAQCFSYYTYYKSEFQFLICDIQGVGTCLTDPAICTKNNSKIDPTDMGQEGIGRYIVSFGAVKKNCQAILEALQIDG